MWFESGVSYAAVLEAGEGIGDPADLYLEGSDQHRGWFHTSLLTSIATRKRAPYRRVLTHGFVVDGEGRKYSKSSRNYVPPQVLIDQHGAELLRYWVAAEDYREDIRFSDEILTRCVEAYRKLRNTARYILGNLYDFDPDGHLLPEKKMEEIDRFALAELGRVTRRVCAAYESFDFHVILHTIIRFCAVEMSAFYLDVLKDRLYAEGKDSGLRRSAQSALWSILNSVTRLLAPVLSFTADEIWRSLPRARGEPECVFLADMPEVRKLDEKLLARWGRLIDVRQVVTKALEMARADKFIGNSLAARVVIERDKGLRKFLEGFGDSLADLFIVSGVEFETAQGKYVAVGGEGEHFKVAVATASGQKCQRCWKYSTSVGKEPGHPEICSRCAGVVAT